MKAERRLRRIKQKKNISDFGKCPLVSKYSKHAYPSKNAHIFIHKSIKKAFSKALSAKKMF